MDLCEKNIFGAGGKKQQYIGKLRGNSGTFSRTAAPEGGAETAKGKFFCKTVWSKEKDIR